MRINSIQHTNRLYTPMVRKNKTHIPSGADYSPIKTSVYPININFTSAHNIKNSDLLMYRDMSSMLHDEVLEVKQELALAPANSSLPKTENYGPSIDLSKFSLKQRLILKEYASNPNLKRLLEMDKAVSSNEDIIQSIFVKKLSLIKKYDSQTYDKFTDANSTKEEKTNAFGLAVVFLASAMRSADYEKLKEILDKICAFKNSVSSLDILLNGDCSAETKDIFDIAKQYWYENELPKLMDDEFQKMIYIEEAANQNKILQNLKSFADLPIDEKYYVAKYFQNQKGTIKKDDPMIEILSNRTIADPAEVIREMSNKISIDEESFYSEINDSYSLINSTDGIENLSKFDLGSGNQGNNISMLDLYLLLFGRIDLIVESDKSKIVEFFRTISDEEMAEANKSIIEEWEQNYLPEKIDKEVFFKAHETDVNTQIIKELKQINQNLGNITIKLDDMTISLDKLVSNMDRMYAKFDNPPSQIKELQQTILMYTEAMKKAMLNMTPEESQRVMQTLKTDGVKYLDVLESKTTNLKSRAMINNIRQTLFQSNGLSPFIARLEGYAPIPISQYAVGTVARGINKSKIQYAAKQHIKEGYNETTAYRMAGQDAATGKVAMPISTVAELAAIAGITAGLYSIYKASNVHREFSDLYFGE